MNKTLAGILATGASLVAGKALASPQDDLNRVAQYVRNNPTSSYVETDSGLRGVSPGDTVYESSIGDMKVQVGPNFISIAKISDKESDVFYDIGMDGQPEGLVAVHKRMSPEDVRRVRCDILERGRVSLDAEVNETFARGSKDPIDNRLALARYGNSVGFYDFSKGEYGKADMTPSKLDEAQQKVVDNILAQMVNK